VIIENDNIRDSVHNKLAKLIQEYEVNVETYNYCIAKNKFNSEDIAKFKETCFYFRN
jgi:UDP-glucose 6-dehydrogenase